MPLENQQNQLIMIEHRAKILKCMINMLLSIYVTNQQQQQCKMNYIRMYVLNILTAATYNDIRIWSGYISSVRPDYLCFPDQYYENIIGPVPSMLS